MIITTPHEKRGFRQYPVPPLFICNPRKGRVHWDFEEYMDDWFISERMKAVLESLDADAFAFLKCDIRRPDGSDEPARWLCDVVRVLDALDEQKSKVWIGTADDGGKVYGLGGDMNLVSRKSSSGRPSSACATRRVPVCDERLWCWPARQRASSA